MTTPVCTLDLARMRRDRIDKLRAAMDRRRRRHARALRPGERLVRDRRPRARRPTTCAPSWWRAVAVRRARRRRGRISTPSSPRASPVGPPRRPPPPARSRSRRPTGAAELVAQARRAAGSRSTTRPSRCGRRSRGRDVDRRRRRSSRRPSSPRPSTSSSASARRRRSTSGRCAPCAPLAQPGALATDLSGAFLRAIAELGATVEHRRPRVPGDAALDRRRSVQRHRRAGVPAPDARRRAASGRRAVDRHRHQPQRLRVRLRRDLDRRRRARRPTRDRSSTSGARSSTACSRSRSPARPAPISCAAARERTGRRPWLSYFYLAHGIGTDSAEMPFIGTDRGDAFDASIVLATGHGARVRARRVGRRPRRPSQRGDRRGHRRRLPVALEPGRARRSGGVVSRLELEYCLERDGARRHRRAGARPRGERARRLRTPTDCGSPGPGAFAPGCVVVRSTGAVHLLANSNDGFERLPASSTSTASPGIPTKLLGALARDPGLHRRAARRRRRHVTRHARALRASWSRRPRSSTPGRSSPSCGACLRPEKIAGGARGRARRARRARGDGRRRSATACARACCAACAPSASRRSASRRPRSRRSPPRSTAARPPGCRPSALLGDGRERRAPRRRAAQRLGGVARAHLRGRRRRRSSSRRPTGGTTLVGAVPRRARRVGHLRDLEAVVYGVGRGVEPYDDDLVLEPGMVFALELHREPPPAPGRRCTSPTTGPVGPHRPRQSGCTRVVGRPRQRPIWRPAPLDDLHAPRLDARPGRSRDLPSRGSRGPRSSSLRRRSCP